MYQNTNRHGVMNMKTPHERENYSWGILQDMIEREVSSAFKIRPQSVCKRWKTKKLGKDEYWTPNSLEVEMPSKKEIKQIIKHTIEASK